MCAANEHAGGYVLLIEDHTAKHSGNLKKYAKVAFISKKFQGRQMSLTMYTKKFLDMFRIQRIQPHTMGCEKPNIVMTDNEHLTRFSQAKHILYGTFVIKPHNSTSN